MSTSNQSNGKKTSSTNNSMTNTPSSTPVSTIANPQNNQAPMQSSTPPNNAPKYGTLVPNRIFVGGISANTTEAELLQLFSNYGTVKAAKIIQDRAGVSKGYGFITFESEEEAKRLQREADNIVLRERKLNIAPAIKKQPFSRAFDASSPPTIAPGGPTQYFIPAGGVPFYQGGVTYYPQPAPPGDPNNQQPPVYQQRNQYQAPLISREILSAPAVYPAQSGPPQTAAYPSIVYPTQPLYMPQQFPYQPVPYEYNYYPNGGPQYMVGNQGAPQPQGPPMQPPGSPPRTPCYNPPLSYTTDAMYYNMPMYGGPVEGTTIYQDSLDMANGNLTEEYNFIGGVSQELEASLPRPNINNTPEFTNPNTTDTTRQSNTPVVSLLSLDQHQEKDFTSMQSGRRRKSVVDPIPSTNSVQHHFGHNSFVSPPYPNVNNSRNSYSSIISGSNTNPSHNFPPPAPVNAFNGCLPFTSPPPPQNDFFSGKFPPNPNAYKSAPNVNSNDKSLWYNNKRRNRTTDRRNSDVLARSESNSSASAVDENRNEDKNFRTTINTPPPAPYSPIMQYGNMGNKYNSRNYHGNVRPTRGGYQNYNNNNSTRSHNMYVSNTNRPMNTTRHTPPPPALLRKPSNNRNFNKNIASNTEESKNVDSNSNDKLLECSKSETVTVSNTPEVPEPSKNPLTNCSLPPQIPPAGTQNFIPPTRRTRRSVRRGTHAGAPLSEIGAGDAPLPSTEVADTCKKLDNLKL